MATIIPFRTPEIMRNRISVDLEPAVAVARRISLRPGPEEMPSQFVARIVRAYKEEGGK